MAHGNYGKSKRSVSGRLIKGKGEGGRGKGLGVRGGNGGKGKGKGKGKDFHKKASIRNQIRSIERLLRKTAGTMKISILNLPHEIRNAQEKKLEELRNLLNFHVKAKLERKMALRYRKVKFFERRKIERRIRRLEKQRLMFENKGQDLEMQGGEMSKQLAQLKEDLEYVRFFPKTEKYISLFMGGDDPEVVANRNKLREMIKANLAAAAASGVDLEETGSDDDGALDISEDDFFLDGSSSDDADADDEWTDKSTRELGSVASGKAVSGMSGDEINKMVKTAHDSKSPKHDSIAAKDSSRKTGSSRINKTQVVRNRSGCGVTLRCGPSSSGGRSKYAERDKSSGYDPSSSSEVLRAKNSSQGGVISSNSDAPVKRRRKRRPKKKH